MKLKEALIHIGASGAAQHAGAGLLAAATKVLAAALIVYSGYVVYDTNYIEKQAFNSVDLLQYRPAIIDDAGAALDANTLASINPDYRGWLTMYDTNIDYPVMQAEDDVYYVSHDIYRRASLSGAIYMAAANSRDARDNYNLLYGHHMDNGSMFGGLDLYAEPDYLDAHRRGILVAESDVYDLRVFALARTDAYEGVIYSAGNRMEGVLHYLRHPDGKKTEVLYFDEAELGDARQIMALSTCASDETNGRLVLFVVMLPRGLDVPSSVIPVEEVREPDPPREVRYDFDPEAPEELTEIDDEGVPTGVKYVYDPDAPGELIELDEAGVPTGARFILDPEHPGELLEIADEAVPLDWRSTFGNMTIEELLELLDGEVPLALLSAYGGMANGGQAGCVPCYNPCYNPCYTPCNSCNSCGGQSGCNCGGATCTGECGGSCGGSANCGGKASFFARFQPGGAFAGRAWALVNLIALLVTAYLLLPVMHIKAKYGRARVMEEINRKKKDLYEAAELDDRELMEKTMIELYATVENARAEGESVRAAVRAAKAASFADVSADDFAASADALFYQVRRFLRRFRAGIVLELALVLAALVTFLLTEDLRLPMTLVDQWTPLMLLYLALCWLVDVRLVRYRGRVRAEDDNKLRRAAKRIIDRA